jgi:hypothetical protein
MARQLEMVPYEVDQDLGTAAQFQEFREHQANPLLDTHVRIKGYLAVTVAD